MIDYDMIRVMGDVDVDFSLRQVSPTDSYILRSADGITAPEFNMQIANTLYQGGVFQNRQALNKQVVLNIKLNPNYGAGETVKSLRQDLYKMLSPRWKRPVKVQLVLAGAVVAEIEGHVSGIPMNPFAKEPEVQLTIDCLSSCFFAPTPVNYLPENSDEFLQINYAGSAPVGFWMQVLFTTATNGFRIRHEENIAEKVQIDYQFALNDILTIDTRPGLRSITLTRSAVPSSLLSGLTNDSTWIEIYEGLNDLRIDGNIDWIGISYIPQWWGA